MEITFRLDLDDWNAFLKAVKARGAQFWIVAPIFIVMAFQLLSDRRLRLRWQFGGIEALWPHILVYLLPLTFIFVFWVATHYYQKQQLRKLPLLAGPITIKADDEGISGTSISGRDTIFWPAIHKIIETQTHFFVLSAPQAGLIVPKRAFASGDDATRFGAFLNDKWARHRKDVAPIAAPE